MVSLTWRMLVQRGVVDTALWAAVVLWGDHHSTTPCHWLIHRNLLDYAQPLILIKTCFDRLLPMTRDRARRVYRYRFRSCIYEQSKWRCSGHKWECLLLAAIKRAAAVPV